MTDTEIVRACGEAMGWTYEVGKVSEMGEWEGHAPGWRKDGEFVASRDWDPLTSDTAWAQVLDEMAKQGFRPGLGFGPTVGKADRWYLEWMPIGESYMVGVDFYPTDEGRRRAVVVGFLKAKGLYRQGEK